ncbi:B12-binding domain-containing radical SAM protein [Methylorubrum aminovorans]
MAVCSSDVSLCFVPQWSPFQPPLSLPSLAAWVRREGYSCNVLDENISFYDFLLSGEAVDLLRESGRGSAVEARDRAVALEALDCWREFRADVRALLRWNTVEHTDLVANRNEFLRDNYRSIKSLSSYLEFVSIVSDEFSISPYDFTLKEYGLNRNDLERFAHSAPVLLATFAESAASRILADNPRVVGLSCIGQEQLPFTLLIGKEVKSRSEVPVLIGGTVFSRLAERGAVPQDWFGKFFDVIVRNEGERPLSRLLALREWKASALQEIPGIVFANQRGVVANKPSAPLRPSELPVPEFEGMPLNQYLSGQITLPVLSARGCYWGKCEFCHHGMVYGEKYEAYDDTGVQATIRNLAKKFRVTHFAFNDEAIPPRTLRRLGLNWVGGAELYFTGLIKFEEYFSAEDFKRAYDIGFRTLYVGLESASERVLALMKKNTRKSVIQRNLIDAHDAGIWMHCFLFFGFPGEQHDDAQETIDFIVQNANVMGSYGAGTFSLEHNAPIMARLAHHGVNVAPMAAGELSVYYEYDVANGINQREAHRYVDELSMAVADVDKFQVVAWIPREHLLVLRSVFNEMELIKECRKIADLGDIGVFLQARSEWSATQVQADGSFCVINRLNSAVVEIRGASADIVKYGMQGNVSAREVCDALPWVGNGLASQRAVGTFGQIKTPLREPLRRVRDLL